jgi:hypothetical protein
MRTTLDIDDDVLAAVKERARALDTTAGKVLSDLAREQLTRGAERYEFRNGVPVLPPTGKIITSEMVRKWLEDDI